MRVACIHSQIKIGGADRRLIDLANTLAKEKHEVFLYLMSDDNYWGYDIDSNIKIINIAKKSKIPKTQWFSNVFSLRKRLKNDEVDFAVSFIYPMNIQLMLAKRGTKVKTLISERGDPNKQPGGGIWKFLRDKTYGNTDGIVYQTQGARKYYIDHIGLNGKVIHNPVEIGDIVAKPIGNKVIANIGLLEPHKNQHRLIYAFSVFSKDHPEYRLRICGGGYLEDELKRYANALGVNDKIIWMGKVPDAYKVIAEDDFFVLSSDFEGMPNALMEAMALGMPCISTDCAPGGARELIQHGENGLLSELDDGDDLAKKMKIMADDSGFAAEMGKKAAEIRQTHSSGYIYSQWLDYIKEIVEK